MAKKRMFTNDVVSSDAFIDMPLTAQALYFHLSMSADDDGFNDRPRQVMRIIGANKNDMDILIAKRFILTFDDSVIVIKHWKMHNYIAKDRYTFTNYQKYYNQLEIGKNKAYSLVNTNEKKVYADCIQHVDTDIDKDLDEEKDKIDILDKYDIASQADDRVISSLKPKSILSDDRIITLTPKSILTKELIKRKFIDGDDLLDIIKYNDLYYQIKEEKLFEDFRDLATAIGYTLSWYRPKEVTDKFPWFKTGLINNLAVIKKLPEIHKQREKYHNEWQDFKKMLILENEHVDNEKEELDYENTNDEE